MIKFKKYKAIIFDWDGTAVLSRNDKVDKVLPAIINLLDKGIVLNIISGTTYENIDKGLLHKKIPVDALQNLYLGLGRGAYNYGFDKNGELTVLHDTIPDKNNYVKLHDLAYDMHKHLYNKYNFNTDIVFSRPNYFKIDLLADHSRGDKLFLQPDEIQMVNEKLAMYGFDTGIKGLMELTTQIAKKFNISVKATTDAKYLEVGFSTKADNVDFFLDKIVFPKGIKISECSFWGDEFTFLGDGIKGSDAFMITEKSIAADFFDVSDDPIKLPYNVKSVKGGVDSFLKFLNSQM